MHSTSCLVVVDRDDDDECALVSAKDQYIQVRVEDVERRGH